MLKDRCPFTGTRVWTLCDIIPQNIINVRQAPVHFVPSIDGSQDFACKKSLPLGVGGVYITEVNDPRTALLLDPGISYHFETYQLSIYPDLVIPLPVPLLPSLSPMFDRAGRSKKR
jgi:hypothetical protein